MTTKANSFDRPFFSATATATLLDQLVDCIPTPTIRTRSAKQRRRVFAHSSEVNYLTIVHQELYQTVSGSR